MRRDLSTACLSLLALSLACLDAKASTWTVDATGGADFTTIVAAVAAAADGDVIIVRSGTYAAFDVIAKSLVVRADAAATVDVLGRTRVESLASIQQLQLIGLRFTSTPASAEPALFAHSNAGPITISACTFRGAAGTNGFATMNGREGALFDGNNNLIVHASSFLGGDGSDTDPFIGWGGDGARVTGGSCLLLDSTMRGGNGGEDFDGDENGGRGGHGLSAASALVSAARMLFVGGHGGYGGFSDLFQTCKIAGAGGDAVALTGGATLADNASTFTPGARGTFVCDPGSQPPPTGASTSGGAAAMLAFTPFCFGLQTHCPCGNTGFGASGCDTSFATGGGRLGANGNPSVSNDTLEFALNGLPATGTAILFQGTAMVGSANAGLVFGDGLRCAGGTVQRLGAHPVIAGGAAFGPSSGDAPISISGNVPTSGGARFYQGWFRNAAAFCTPGTFNLTQGLQVTWIP